MSNLTGETNANQLAESDAVQAVNALVILVIGSFAWQSPLLIGSSDEHVTISLERRPADRRGLPYRSLGEERASCPETVSPA